jgi:protein SCO1/2
MAFSSTIAATRRHVLKLGLLAAAAAASPLLVGCQKMGEKAGEEAPSFKGIDLTGAPYGKDFRLTDPDGKERTLADFKGKVVLLYFGFTQCPDVCPTELTRDVEVLRLLGPDADRVQVIMVTVDPERDTPQVLRNYTAAFHPSFLGLYGDAQRTRETADAFKVYYKKVPTGGSYTMDHSTLTYVFDPEGRLRLALRHEQSAADVVHDLKQILAGK